MVSAEVVRREGYTMATARRRFKAEPPATRHGWSFRQWARRTYNAHAAMGKLAQLVGRPE